MKIEVQGQDSRPIRLHLTLWEAVDLLREMQARGVWIEYIDRLTDAVTEARTGDRPLNVVKIHP